MSSTGSGRQNDSSELERARASFAERAWDRAFAGFGVAAGGPDQTGELALADLELAAVSAALTGRDTEFLGALEQIHKAALAIGESQRAARAALWSLMRLHGLGENARAMGWVGRLRQLAERAGDGSLEQCYLHVPLTFAKLGQGDVVEAERLALYAVSLADQHADADMQAFMRSLAGRALLRQTKTEAGFALLDECMLSVTAGAVSPIMSALVYCTVIASCHEVYALDRAREWTAALTAWCDAQPELVAFRGICMVHRAELARLAGDWPRATEQAERASVGVPGHQHPDSVGEAYYELGELHRLRGELANAELAYGEAQRQGREPHPGIALLRVAQGRTDAAVSGLRRVLAEVQGRLARAKILPAAVEILLAAGAEDEALAACSELEATALALGADALVAFAAHARAAVFLHAGDAQAALGPLRRAFFIWRQIGAPYSAAKVRLDLARACEALGDRAGAELERDCARATFASLGASLDLAALAPVTPAVTAAPSHGLSERELQVLRLVATGETNKGIANVLTLSEKTVDRHVSNIFGKLGVQTRAAATAFAYEHDLIAR